MQVHNAPFGVQSYSFFHKITTSTRVFRTLLSTGASQRAIFNKYYTLTFPILPKFALYEDCLSWLERGCSIRLHLSERYRSLRRYRTGSVWESIK